MSLLLLLHGPVAKSGTASGSTATSGTVLGRKDAKGTASGSTVTAGQVTGTAKRAGTVTGATASSASVTGTTGRKGTASGTTTSAGQVTGKAARRGSASGVTSTAGHRDWQARPHRQHNRLNLHRRFGHRHPFPPRHGVGHDGHRRFGNRHPRDDLASEGRERLWRHRVSGNDIGETATTRHQHRDDGRDWDRHRVGGAYRNHLRLYRDKRQCPGPGRSPGRRHRRYGHQRLGDRVSAAPRLRHRGDGQRRADRRF